VRSTTEVNSELQSSSEHISKGPSPIIVIYGEKGGNESDTTSSACPEAPKGDTITI
jgi:hypothetical protein